jgi:hypothetical protein
MARPRIDDIEKRIVQVNIRLTKDEAEKVDEYAKASGISPANWIRSKVFTGRFPPLKVSTLDMSIYLELKKIGVNINQATHRLNLDEKPDAIFLRCLLDLRALLDRIESRLLYDGQPDKG